MVYKYFLFYYQLDEGKLEEHREHKNNVATFHCLLSGSDSWSLDPLDAEIYIDIEIFLTDQWSFPIPNITILRRNHQSVDTYSLQLLEIIVSTLF